MTSLQGKTVLFFAAPLYEDLELWYPKIRLEEEGSAPSWPAWASGPTRASAATR
jgi:hypothetical protein